MTYTAFVPARSGSKRFPHKNIKLLDGKPLLVWTLEACVNAAGVDEVIFSTDSMEYWNIVRLNIDSKKIILDFRSSEESGDTVKIFDYLKTKREKIFESRKGAFIVALPTVPLRTSSHIEEAIALYEKSGKPIFSATTYGFPISFSFRLTDVGGWAPVFCDNPMVTGNTRSQDQQEAYRPNGAIYIRSIADLSDTALLSFYSDAQPYLMSRNDSIDIDTEFDFKIVSSLI